MNTAHAAILLAVALGLSGSACAQGTPVANDPPAPAGDVTLSVAIPGALPINAAGDAMLSEDVTLTLTNTSATEATLEASNDCVSHTWYVTDARDQLVDGETMCPMIYEPVSLALKAGANFSATRQISLTKMKYTNGARYTLHYSFWTVEGTASFIAQVAP